MVLGSTSVVLVRQLTLLQWQLVVSVWKGWWCYGEEGEGRHQTEL